MYDEDGGVVLNPEPCSGALARQSMVSIAARTSSGKSQAERCSSHCPLRRRHRAAKHRQSPCTLGCTLGQRCCVMRNTDGSAGEFCIIWREKRKTEVEGRVPLTRAAPRRVEFNHPNIIAALNAPAEHALDSGRCNPKEDVKTWPSSSSSAA